MNKKPTQEYGWMIIETPEQKKRLGPKREGDQCFDSNGQWWDLSQLGIPFEPDYYYRRKIDPGEGWEIVSGDCVESRDMEFTLDGESWEANGHSHDPWVCAHWITTSCPILAFRRRKVAPVPHPAEGEHACETVPNQIQSGIISLSKRELFAAIAMQGWLASFSGSNEIPDPQNTALRAVQYADALLSELSKSPEKP